MDHHHYHPTNRSSSSSYQWINIILSTVHPHHPIDGTFQLFVTDKELWGHIDGSDPSPTDATKLGEWKIKDAQVMTWILGSIDPLIVLNLRAYKTAKAMWDYLQKVYNQDNSARRFQLEELLREEQRLVTQNAFKKENDVTVGFAAQGKGKCRDMSRTQCYSCKEYGHIASNCSKKFCNYCKKQGHIIKKCPTRPQNSRINAFKAGINGSTNDNSSSGQVLTPEMVQQMIVSAFSALGLQGASNHRTNSTSILKNVRKYQGPSQIQIANASNLPITKVGDITLTFKNDQVSGTIIAKGPKVGRLFPIRFSIPHVLSFACTSTASKTESCYKVFDAIHSDVWEISPIISHAHF
ncbi:hypothetical protein KY285_030281 [Solanum tuberosum]|nr:hypothetical protein KY285_030281 [Solanum tuberosum]